MKTTLFSIFFLLSTSAVFSQKIHALSISAMTETTSYPFTRYLPIHPGLEVGTTFWLKEKNNSKHQINAYLGGYHHKKLENGFYLRGEYAYTYSIKNIIGLDLPLGVGYQHTFYPGEVYEQNAESGNWEKMNHFGKPHTIVNCGFGLRILNLGKVQPFIRHESALDIPLYNGFLNLRTFLKLGINIKLNHE